MLDSGAVARSRGANMPTVEERLASRETKVDTIADLRTEMREFRAEMRDFRADMRAEVSQLRTDMNQRFDQVDRRFGRVDARMDGLDLKVDRHFMWLVTTQAGMVAAFVGWFVAAWLR